MKSKLKTMPSLTSDAEAEAFVDKADLSQFDLTQFQPMQFEFERKSSSFKYKTASTASRCA
jgi:predicted DNA binding CopG/RHH family protein